MIIASATRQPCKEAFLQNTWLGRSLLKLRHTQPIIIDVESKNGLPAFYNSVLDQHPEEDIVFAHDDLAICDVFFYEKLEQALQEFDVVGLAGCRTPKHEAPVAWFNADHSPSGQIGTSPRSDDEHVFQTNIATFGPSPQRAAAMDGVFLAVRAKNLNGLRFDPQFKYHHYDVDFTLAADKSGLRVGTWPIFTVHVSSSGDGYQSRQWRESMELYANKWEGKALSDVKAQLKASQPEPPSSASGSQSLTYAVRSPL
jgi:hypothetical protein